MLFTTSCVMLSVHLLLVCLLHGPIPLMIVYVVGSLTSVWNHATESEVAKWSDRGVMTIGLGLDIWFLWHLPRPWSNIVMLALLLSWSLVWYLGGKLLTSSSASDDLSTLPQADLEDDIWESLPHATAHACIMATHVFMLYYYSHAQ